ncbi:MAG: AI-2E family transporter [Wujia sp.]
MKKWNRNIIQLGVVLALAGCACILFAEIIKQWQSFFGFFGKVISAMTPIFVGIIIAFLLNPIMIYIRRGLSWLVTKISKRSDYDRVYRKAKVPSLILTVLLFLGALVGLLWLVIPRVYESLTDLVNNTQTYIENANAWIQKVFAQNQMIEDALSQALGYLEKNVFQMFRDTIMPNLDTIVKTLSSGVVIGVKAIMNFLIGLVVMIYLLMSKDVLLAQCKKVVYCLFSKKTGNRIMEGANYANAVFGGFINGKILDSLIIGILCFIFTSALNMTYAVLISVIVGVTNIIPFFGPFIGAIPGAFLALMDDPVMLLIFIIWILVLQQFDGNILGPLILGDATGISGVWVLLAILIGGDLFGVVGMVLGVPIFACVYAFFAVQLRDKLRAKSMSSNTADYVRLEGFDEKTGEPIYRDKHEKRKTLRHRRNKQVVKKGWNKIRHKMNEDLNENDVPDDIEALEELVDEMIPPEDVEQDKE